MHHLPKRNNKFQHAVFGGIKKYIQFTFENTCQFIHKDNGNKGLFRDWKQEASVFHFLDNWTNIMVSIAAFGTITIIPIVTAIQTQTRAQTQTQISTTGTGRPTQTTYVKPRYGDPQQRQFLICPLPGELLLCCKRISMVNYDYNDKYNYNYRCNNNSRYAYGRWASGSFTSKSRHRYHRDRGGGCQHWNSVEFFTFDELCQRFCFGSSSGANLGLDNCKQHLGFKDKIRKMFDKLKLIERYFDQDKMSLDTFYNKLIPRYDNLEIDVGFRKQIGYYLRSGQVMHNRNYNNDCNGCGCIYGPKKGTNERKKKFIRFIGDFINGSNGKLHEYIRKEASNFFQAKYQINANKRGRIDVEIVLFCELVDVIVGIPIVLNSKHTKWIIKSILLQEMKQNTMLPKMLLQNSDQYQHLYSGLVCQSFPISATIISSYTRSVTSRITPRMNIYAYVN